MRYIRDSLEIYMDLDGFYVLYIVNCLGENKSWSYLYMFVDNALVFAVCSSNIISNHPDIIEHNENYIY